MNLRLLPVLRDKRMVRVGSRMVSEVIATAWNNGAHHRSGAGYGLRIEISDRNRFFKPEWKSVFLHLEGREAPVEVNIDKPSFWGPACRELINKDIGLWLRENRRAPWPEGTPPKLEVTAWHERTFTVRITG